jgi:hypothetical protein
LPRKNTLKKADKADKADKGQKQTIIYTGGFEGCFYKEVLE